MGKAALCARVPSSPAFFSPRRWLVAEGEYYHEILPDRTVRFTQVLRWDGDPNVFAYEVTVETEAGELVSTWRTEEPVLRINLVPGQYRCCVVLYNLLGKPFRGLRSVDLSLRSLVRAGLARNVLPGTDTAVIDSQIVRAGMNGVYRYPSSRELVRQAEPGSRCIGKPVLCDRRAPESLPAPITRPASHQRR